MSTVSSAYGRFVPIGIVIGFLVMSLLSGCRHDRPDPRLAAADAMMEEHPDSALMILEGYTLTPESTPADSAYYALLLTHARYRNFIDETDDSLISAAAGRFLDHGDRERASRALFLQGMIRMNANRLGDAAVSFRKGLDMAREGGHYVWEGQCARGLCLLYGELYDGSAQVEYAGKACEAFARSGDEGWRMYSTVNLARAFNNNGQYEKALSILSGLESEAELAEDTLVLSELHQLRGVSSFALGRYGECLANYGTAYRLDPSVITAADIDNISVAIQETSRDSVASSRMLLEKLSTTTDQPTESFVVLAQQGRYKEAYEQQKRYREAQDSVLSMIFNNNVAESLHQYEGAKATLAKERIRNERLFYVLIGLIFVVIGITVVWILRERMHRETALRIRKETELESLRSDFQMQVNAAKELSERLSKYTDVEKAEGFEQIVRQHYAETNRLCDEYYQGQYRKHEKEAMQAEMDKVIRSFTEKSSLQEVIRYVDEKSGGLYSMFKQTFFNLSDEECRLFLYLMLGFNSNSISLFLGQKVNGVYTKKARLKSKIKQSGVADCDTYLKFF